MLLVLHFSLSSQMRVNEEKEKRGNYKLNGKFYAFRSYKNYLVLQFKAK